MLTKELLERIGFDFDDIDFILEKNQMYTDEIMPIVKEYVSGLDQTPYVPYEGKGRSLSLQRANQFAQQVQEKIPEENAYVLNLLAWLNCIPYLHDTYTQFGISDDIFYESMKDFSYKAKECKMVYGVLGVFVNWFFLFFELKEFSLGRLQYEAYHFDYDTYTYEDIQLKKGDRVYFCHIPSSGKLTYDMCMESFQKAYEFFKPHYLGDIIPIISDTWLLYQPYIDKVFPEGSNLKRFAKLFDNIDNYIVDNDFYDSWRVFHRSYKDSTKDLPADTTLRRNFIEYINSGGDFGYGYGIILYDGKKKRIVNVS
ncbi:MAG: DUF5596 domain-containing protein [Lachnospiraceae bacterium]|nr:DUF5596 domain-containing protein [Lachnospiraceae bacterium]